MTNKVFKTTSGLMKYHIMTYFLYNILILILNKLTNTLYFDYLSESRLLQDRMLESEFNKKYFYHQICIMFLFTFLATISEYLYFNPWAIFNFQKH